jgi:hypothetical protein
MDFQLRISERSSLLALMTFVTEASNPDITDEYGFTIVKKDREHLEELGLLTSRVNTRPHRGYVHELTDLGWRWCREELGSAVPEGAPRAYRLAYGVVRSFARYMERAGVEMADVFVVPRAPADEPDISTDEPEAPAVEDRIRAAYVDLVVEQDGYVNLNRLRNALDDLPRETLDEALRRLDLQQGVYLIPEANQKTLSQVERAAGIRIGGEDKHLLSIASA